LRNELTTPLASSASVIEPAPGDES
jgi:hypothetical protein